MQDNHRQFGKYTISESGRSGFPVSPDRSSKTIFTPIVERTDLLTRNFTAPASRARETPISFFPVLRFYRVT
jgi:hypothetical protein